MTSRADSHIQVVWFKRDLRIRDHAPLIEAASTGPLVALYLFEPELLQSPDWDPIHSQFIRDSLHDLESALASRGVRLITRIGEAVEQLEALHRALPFVGLWSHEETGNRITFDRDRRIARWCADRGVMWTERRQDGVIRRLRSRDGWSDRWNRTMSARLLPAPESLPAARVDHLPSAGILGPEELGLPKAEPREPQPGGECRAREVLDSFLAERGVGYRWDMSSPVAGWTGCSRLSPYLAWGCVSIRTVHQAAAARAEALRLDRTAGKTMDGRWWGSLSSFQARLRWHCHFMQKLEDEPRIEFENFVRAYDGLREPFTESDQGRERLQAWCDGRTGFPMVDACLRAVRATGWLNFRMRAMVMSFASYALWLHWRPTALHLARCFLDFEPGIHFSQAQMQSGTTGINTLRIYSPAKQAIDQDPQGTFIRRWVPELAGVPDAFLAQPGRMSLSQQEDAGCVIGVDYPRPIVEFRRATAEARRQIVAVRSGEPARQQAREVYQRHGSRRRTGHRGAAADARLRDALRTEPDSPGAENWTQPDLFG